MRRTNNKGFSYVEMLMVLAIMAILIGLVTLSVGVIGRNTVSRTLEKVETLCNKARTNALTKGTSSGYLNIAQFNDGVYAYVGEMIEDDNKDKIRKDGEKICSKEYEIGTNFSNNDDPDNTVGLWTGDGGIHRVAFVQSTGGVIGGLSGRVMVRKKDKIKVESFGIYGQTGKVYDRKKKSK